jgi:hypothetical protein
MHRTMDLIILMFSSIDIVARVNKSTLWREKSMKILESWFFICCDVRCCHIVSTHSYETVMWIELKCNSKWVNLWGRCFYQVLKLTDECED